MPELLRQAVVDDVYNVGMLLGTHNDVAGFEIAVDKIPGVDITQVTDLAVIHISLLAMRQGIQSTHQLACKQ